MEKNKENYFCSLLVILCLLSVVLLGFNAPGPYIIYYSIIICCVFIASVTALDTAIALVLVLNPFALFIRNAAPESVILAGARMEWLIILCFGSLALFGNRRLSLPRGADVFWLLLFLFYGLIMIFVSGSIVQGLLGFRSVVVPALFYLLVRTALITKPNAAVTIVNYAIVSCLLFSILQLAWYYNLFDMGVLQHGGIIAEGGGRKILGYHFERMTSLISGGPANLSIFLGSGFLLSLGVLFSKVKNRTCVNMLLIAGASLTGLAAFLTLSRSVVVLIMISLVCFTGAKVMRKVGSLVWIFFFGILLVGVVFGTAFAGTSLIRTIKVDAIMWTKAVPSGFSALAGSGLTASGGQLVTRHREYNLVDAGFVGIWNMMGIPGLLSILIWCGLIVYYFQETRSTKYKKILLQRNHIYSMIAGSVAIGMLASSAHTAIMMRLGSDFFFYALAGIMGAHYYGERETLYNYSEFAG